MKVCITVAFPFPGTTGTPLHAMELVRNLRKSGIGAFVVQFRNWRNKVEKDSFEGIDVWRIPFPVWQTCLSYLLRRERVDIVHAQHVSAAVMSFMPAKFLKIPFIYEHHSFWIEELKMLGAKKGVLFYYNKFMEDYILKHAEAIIVMSEKIKEEFIKKGVSRTKIHFFYPSVDLEKFNARKAKKISIVGCSPEDLIAMYTGNFSPWQGIDLLLDAVPFVGRAVPNVKFVLAGGKPEEIRTKKEKMKGKTEKIVFLGRQPYEFMPSLMSQADVFLIPRPDSPVNWTTPRKMGEYLAMGKPVLATDVGDHKRILIGNKCGRVTRPDSMHFAKGLIELLRDDNLRLTLGRNARRTAIELFNMETSIKKRINLYETLKK